MTKFAVGRTAALLLTSAIGALAWTGGAFAADEPTSTSRGTALEEVVVTATRREDTVNRVALSITAETQKAMDQKGLHNIQDLQSTVPALAITSALGTGIANVAIRGIFQGGQGAATTGFYLDDTPIQKRNVGGGVATTNGTPLPPLFDLERVEVLRGPQGTLYGGSSEGGTIRYITPTPSLTSTTAYVRSEVSNTKDGTASYELGGAFGAPLIKDVLGFRASIYARHNGGFVDYIDAYSKKPYAKDGNDGDIRMIRGSLLWAPTDKFKATLAYFGSSDRSSSASNNFNLPLKDAIVAPTVCFNTTGATAARPMLNPATVACNSAVVTKVLPGFTYGPYNLSDYQSLESDRLPTSTDTYISSLTLDYDFGFATAKLISSYIVDDNKSQAINWTPIARYRVNAQYGSIVIPSGLNINYLFPDYGRNGMGEFVSRNNREATSHELRLASKGEPEDKLSWVGGLFFSHIKGDAGYQLNHFNQQIAQGLFGLTTATRYGIDGAADDPTGTVFDKKHQILKDTELAIFGEASYRVTEKLKLTAGVRLSRVEFDYNQSFYGPVNGVAIPSVASGTISGGNVVEKPVTPKFAAQYQLTENDLVYASAAKGFRAGGVNNEISRGICGPALDQYGLQPSDLPKTYESDTVWSYEAGGKFRVLNNRMQINGSIYRIDWDNVQLTQSPGFNCGLTFTTNAGAARSQGVELEVQYRITDNLTANLAFGSTEGKYLEKAVAITGPTGVQLVVALQGQKFDLPPWTISGGFRYDHQLTEKVNGYARVDYRYTADYEHVPFGLGAWTPDSNFVPVREITNIRLGGEYGALDVSFFVNNLFNPKKGPIAGGRGGCPLQAAGGTTACTTFSTYNPFLTTNWGVPRQIGLQLAYRY